jgi:hypothetical protein
LRACGPLFAIFARRPNQVDAALRPLASDFRAVEGRSVTGDIDINVAVIAERRRRNAIASSHRSARKILLGERDQRRDCKRDVLQTRACGRVEGGHEHLRLWRYGSERRDR